MASWADKMRTAAAAPVVAPAAPPMRVVAVDPADEPANAPVFDDTLGGYIAEEGERVLVLDTNALIKGLDDLLSVATTFVTVPQVLQEVKDKRTRDFVDRLPVKLHLMDPGPESIKRVLDLATKTGDVGALSRTDIRVAALALECCESNRALREAIEPRPAVVNPAAQGITTVTEEVVEEATEQEQGGGRPHDGDHAGAEEGEEGSGSSWDGSSDGEESEGEWITSENIHEHSNAPGAVHFAQAPEIRVACVTSDFPIQNVMMHMGVPIVGPQGMVIKQLRLWLLRCHACFNLEHDTTKQFCTDCGSGDTLKRVAYQVSSTGEKILFINYRRRINTRGTIFNLPKPRGGKRGTNKTLCLREDQLANCGRNTARLKEKQVMSHFDDDLAEFGADGKKHRFNPDKPRLFSSYKRYNVNERRKVLASRKK
jgi:RNA-binding protein NOB1